MGPRARLAMGLGLMLLAPACGAAPPQTPVAAKATPTASLAAHPSSAGGQCSALTVTASRQSPITAGDVVTITARAGGCQAPDYRFVLLDQTGGTTVMRDWAPAPAWTWNSGSTLSAQLAVRADARAHGGTRYVPDVSAYLQFVVRGTAAAAVQTCRLPVSGVLPGAGGFVQMPGGAFEADATSNVPLRGQADQSRLRRGYTYDPVHGHWLPVP